jgi:hypothetical protein
MRNIYGLVLTSPLDNVRFLMSEMGEARFGYGRASTKKRALQATRQAISHMLFADIFLENAKHVLVNFTTGPDMKNNEIQEAMEIVREDVHEDAIILWNPERDGHHRRGYASYDHRKWNRATHIVFRKAESRQGVGWILVSSVLEAISYLKTQSVDHLKIEHDQVYHVLIWIKNAAQDRRDCFPSHIMIQPQFITSVANYRRMDIVAASIRRILERRYCILKNL